MTQTMTFLFDMKTDQHITGCPCEWCHTERMNKDMKLKMLLRTEDIPMNDAEKNTLEIIRSEMMRVDGELSILLDHHREMKKLVDVAAEQIRRKTWLKKNLGVNAYRLLNKAQIPITIPKTN